MMEMEELLTVQEVAQMLRVDDTTVRRWIAQGLLEVVVLPHMHERQSYRIPRSVVEAILRGQSHGTGF